MKRSGFLRSLVVVLLCVVVSRATAADPLAQSLAGRPYYSLFASSIDRLLAVCDAAFDSVDRPDLAQSLGERLKSYRNFAGIDRSKSLGMMSVWNNSGSADVVFLPVEDINELLKTATFNIVGFHEAGPNRYEIERPGSPYHVVVKNNWALFADSVSIVQALHITPEQLTRGLRDRYDVILHLDLKQIPQPLKVKYVESLRAEAEPWLQPQDDEPVEAGNLRKTVGKLVLDLVQRLILDTTSVTVGAQLDPKTRHIVLEVIVEAAPASPMAGGLNRLVSRRNEFTSLISSDVPVGIALNLPLGGLVEQVLGQNDKPAAGDKSLEAGLQIVGNEIGKLSLIGALRGDEAIQLNSALPRLIVKLDESGTLSAVRENFHVHQGIVFHSLIPRELPDVITDLVGRDVEIIVGQGKQVVWLAVGNPETLPDHLKDAIDRVDVPSTAQKTVPLVRARIQAKQLPELAASDLLGTKVDTEASRAAFVDGGDGFNLTLEPIANGIKLRLEAEEGFVRLIGRDWVKQIEDSQP